MDKQRKLAVGTSWAYDLHASGTDYNTCSLPKAHPEGTPNTRMTRVALKGPKLSRTRTEMTVTVIHDVSLLSGAICALLQLCVSNMSLSSRKALK